MNNGNKEPHRDNIIRVLKEQYKDNKNKYLSARELHDLLNKNKIKISLENMYRVLDKLCTYGYVEVVIDRDFNNNKYKRLFRYNPF